jgi:hypothetical protein
MTDPLVQSAINDLERRVRRIERSLQIRDNGPPELPGTGDLDGTLDGDSGQLTDQLAGERPLREFVRRSVATMLRQSVSLAHRAGYRLVVKSGELVIPIDPETIELEEVHE